MNAYSYEVQYRPFGKRNWVSTDTKYEVMPDAVNSLFGVLWTHSVRILRCPGGSKKSVWTSGPVLSKSKGFKTK